MQSMIIGSKKAGIACSIMLVSNPITHGLALIHTIKFLRRNSQHELVYAAAVVSFGKK